VPLDEYRRRLHQRRATHERLSSLDSRLSLARLGVFGAAAVAALAVWNGWLSVWLLLAPVLAFLILVVRHDHVIRSRDAASRAITFYERGLARLEDRWSGAGEPGERFRDDHHLYANDLDLFGPGSLFELLSLARTRAGEDTLAGWLKTPADSETVYARQAAVQELTPELDLREALSMAGSDVRAGVQGEALVRWAEGPALLTRRWLRPAALLVTTVTISTAVVWGTTGDPAPFVAALLFQMLFAIPQRRPVEQALHAADGPARDLDILSHILTHLERTEFASERLTALRRQLDTHGIPASRAIHALHRLVEMHDWQHNFIFAVVGAVLLWGTHLAWAIEAWREKHGRQIRHWLSAVGEFEAFSSLSAYRYEHPNDPFPELVVPASRSGADGLFEGIDLGHPLLPAARMVRNDVRLSGPTRLIVVSGSNMSGKSTLLRTVGVNTVLALAGAPVRAASLRLSPLTVGATLRIQDSLQEGRSRFYAEITRIRELTQRADGPVPLLFLLDELFHGTNSHDRLVGASGVLRNLLDKGALGLITTHDLALTAVADALAPLASNVHFEDWFEGGEMRFDYRAKPGPVTRSNAIALMKAVGLDVGDAPAT
jgi:hypothetical protein